MTSFAERDFLLVLPAVKMWGPGYTSHHVVQSCCCVAVSFFSLNIDLASVWLCE